MHDLRAVDAAALRYPTDHYKNTTVTASPRGC